MSFGRRASLATGVAFLLHFGCPPCAVAQPCAVTQPAVDGESEYQFDVCAERQTGSFEISGHQMGTYEVRITVCFQLNDSIALFSIEVPDSGMTSLGRYSTSWSAESFRVADEADTEMDTLRTERSGLWGGARRYYVVRNPTPGRSHIAALKLQVRQSIRTEVRGSPGAIDTSGSSAEERASSLSDHGRCDWKSAAVRAASAGLLRRAGGDSRQYVLLLADALAALPYQRGVTTESASKIWERIEAHQRGGAGGFDCGELAIAACAALRAAAIPARTVVTIPTYCPALCQGKDRFDAFHAIVEYWNGCSWEQFEPQRTLGFAFNQVRFGAATDMTRLGPLAHPVRDSETVIARITSLDVQINSPPNDGTWTRATNRRRTAPGRLWYRQKFDGPCQP